MVGAHGDEGAGRRVDLPVAVVAPAFDDAVVSQATPVAPASGNDREGALGGLGFPRVAPPPAVNSAVISQTAIVPSS